MLPEVIRSEALDIINTKCQKITKIYTENCAFEQNKDRCRLV